MQIPDGIAAVVYVETAQLETVPTKRETFSPGPVGSVFNRPDPPGPVGAVFNRTAFSTTR